MRAIIVPFVVASLAGAGCATKKYVSREVGEVNQKVDTLAAEVEKTQERVKKNEVRIDAVDKETQRAHAGVAEAKGSAQQALVKATEAEKTAEKAARGKLIYTVTLSNDKVTFPVNRAQVGDDAKQLIDEAVAQLKAENKGVYFEIEGHTDSTGPDEYNLKLGQERAEAVRNYMHDTHEIALNRMQVISYGEAKPVVDNNNKANRAQNRRVVIKVLE